MEVAIGLQELALTLSASYIIIVQVPLYVVRSCMIEANVSCLRISYNLISTLTLLRKFIALYMICNITATMHCLYTCEEINLVGFVRRWN